MFLFYVLMEDSCLKNLNICICIIQHSLGLHTEYSIDRAMVLDNGCPLKSPEELLENADA